MKKIWFVCSLLAFLCACHSSPMDDSGDQKTEYPVRLTKEIAPHLLIDAEVIPPDQERYHTYQGRRVFLNADIIKETFADLLADDSGFRIEPDYGYYSWSYLNKSLFYSGELRFATAEYLSQYHHANLNIKRMNGDSSNYEYAEDFSGLTLTESFDKLSQEDAVDSVKEIADQLQLPLQPEPYVCAGIDADELRRIINEYSSKEELEAFKVNPEIDDESFCYFILWRFECDETPVMSGNFSWEETEGLTAYNRGAFLYACVSDEGIESLYISPDYELSLLDEDQRIISLDTVCDVIKNKYQDDFLSADLMFYKIEFCYLPYLADDQNKLYHMTPIWAVYGFQEPDEGGRQHSIVLINAISGEELSGN